VEAKPAGRSLVGVEEQSTKNVTGVPVSLPVWHDPLPFCHECTGSETRFTNRLNPDPRRRNVFASNLWPSQSEGILERRNLSVPAAAAHWGMMRTVNQRPSHALIGFSTAASFCNTARAGACACPGAM
jgi:hypothetical protein